VIISCFPDVPKDEKGINHVLVCDIPEVKCVVKYAGCHQLEDLLGGLWEAEESGPRPGAVKYKGRTNVNHFQ
jgi:hypothetical protein